MKRLFISSILALALMVVPVAGALAAPTATVNVTAVPSFISISISPTDWTMNGINGSGVLDIDTTYYSKASGSETLTFSDPVTDAECYHAVTNTSGIDVNLKADMANFANGIAPMTNGGGTAGANAFAAWVCEGGSAADWSTDKVVMETTGSGTFWASSTPGADIEVAFGVQTQTSAWTDATSQASTITLTATAAA